jgi:hypothetical protein
MWKQKKITAASVQISMAKEQKDVIYNMVSIPGLCADNIEK